LRSGVRAKEKPRFNGLGFLAVGIMPLPFQYIVVLGFEQKVSSSAETVEKVQRRISDNL
jgi:hypothetical protein